MNAADARGASWGRRAIRSESNHAGGVGLNSRGNAEENVMPTYDARSTHLYRPVNDIAGLPAEPIPITDHVLLPWEKRCHALLECLNIRRYVSTEEKRRAVEDMGATIYAALTYYEKWAMCAANVLLTKGLITSDGLAQKIHDVRDRLSDPNLGERAP